MTFFLPYFLVFNILTWWQGWQFIVRLFTIKKNSPITVQYLSNSGHYVIICPKIENTAF
jgi:hypothetical protein